MVRVDAGRKLVKLMLQGLENAIQANLNEIKNQKNLLAFLGVLGCPWRLGGFSTFAGWMVVTGGWSPSGIGSKFAANFRASSAKLESELDLCADFHDTVGRHIEEGGCALRISRHEREHRLAPTSHSTAIGRE